MQVLTRSLPLNIRTLNQIQGFKKNYFEGLNWKDHKLTIQDDTTLYFCATCIPTAVSE